MFHYEWNLKKKRWNLKQNENCWKTSLTINVSPEVPPPTECEDVDDLYGPDAKAELPSHLSITKDVMERCIHLLSDPSLKLRLKVAYSHERKQRFEKNKNE